MEQLIDTINPDAARRAFEEMQPLLDTQVEYRRTNINLDRALVTAAALGRRVQEPEVRTRFESLPQSEFNIAHADRLELAALATWYSSLSRKRAATVASGARLPEDTVAAATEVKQRMLQVAEYHLGDRPDVAAELADIRAGSGYIDLGADLMRLADLYEQHGDELSADSRHYQADDRDLARRLALAMHQVLGDGRESDAAYWNDYQTRAWSLLIETYEEVSAAGRWLFRHENGEELFPSLYAAGRRARSGSSDSDDGTDDSASTGNRADSADISADDRDAGAESA